MRISAPPTISPCYYGIDTPHKNELIAAQQSVENIRTYIRADSLRYLDLESIYRKLTPVGSMCDACFSERYPLSIQDLVTLP